MTKAKWITIYLINMALVAAAVWSYEHGGVNGPTVVACIMLNILSVVFIFGMDWPD